MLWHTPAVFLASITMADDVRYSTRPLAKDSPQSTIRPNDQHNNQMRMAEKRRRLTTMMTKEEGEG